MITEIKGFNLTIPVNNFHLSYDDVGEGKIPIIFLHGYPFDKNMWQGQLNFLTSSYRLIACDIRGFGKSTDEKTDLSIDLFFNSLPQPGQPGTLRSVLSNEKPSDKERIHAKSGSLANVRCYAGYTVRKNGEIIHFAILTNNFSARTAQMQIGIEGFMRELTKY